LEADVAKSVEFSVEAGQAAYDLKLMLLRGEAVPPEF